MKKDYILSQAQIELKLQRLALEILEQNAEAEELVLIGVAPRGTLMNEKLRPLLQAIRPVKVVLAEIELDKKHPTEVVLSGIESLHNRVVILVDDVANSGKTLTYALKPILQFIPQKIQTCVLVERTHKQYPVQADYVGISLATTLQEYIEVEVLNNQLVGAWMA